ncbi:MAG: hypothetical protein EOM80_08610 [Erysipelotrichia bacterium]|nr:hypothetical protein [Erysipelotrichia bacterium]
MKQILLSRIKSVKPDRLAKTFRLVNDELVKEPGGNMSLGTVEVCQISNLEQLSEIILSLNHNEALCFGIPECMKAGDVKNIVPEQMVSDDKIARSNTYFIWNPDAPGILMFDYDPQKGGEVLSKNKLIDIIRTVVPELKDVAMLWVPSSSSYIYNAETNEEVSGLQGQRLYVAVEQAQDIPLIGETIFKRLWLAGYGRIEISKSGSFLVRSIIDKAVWQPCRLDFAAGAYCVTPLVQRRGEPDIICGSKEILQ